MITTLSYIREAMINLFSAKLRSFLAILGVLVGTGSVVALISSSQLATAHALAQFKKLGTNLLSVYVHDQSFGQPNPAEKQFLLSDVPTLMKSSSQIAAIAPYTLGFQSMLFNTTAISGQIVGATESFADIAKVELASGRFVSYLDRHSFFCVIGAAVAKKIELLGRHPLHNQILVGNEFFTIIGVLKHWPENFFISADINNSLIIPLPTSYFLSKHTQIENILIRLAQHPNIALAKTQIMHAMHHILPKKKVVFNSPEQLIQLVGKQRETLSLLLIAIGSISLVVGGIGVMNIMLVSVIERKREIGVRVAIGARQFDILRMFLIESVILTIFGGLLGVMIGVLSSYIFVAVAHWQFHFYLSPVVLGFVVSVIVGICSGFYPAWDASRLDPVNTLMGE